LITIYLVFIEFFIDKLDLKLYISDVKNFEIGL